MLNVTLHYTPEERFTSWQYTFREEDNSLPDTEELLELHMLDLSVIEADYKHDMQLYQEDLHSYDSAFINLSKLIRNI